MKTHKNTKGGYIALISSMIISSVIVTIVASISQTSFLNRASISGVHFKEKSNALAESCANSALLKLANDLSYSGVETITVASDTCEIFGVFASSTGRIIEVQGEFSNSFTNIRITAASNTLDIIRWEEIKNF